MVGGLEVQDSEGNFVPASPVPETVVVNIGDLLQRWSNDVLKSTIHRVVLPMGPEVAMTPRRNSIVRFISSFQRLSKVAEAKGYAQAFFSNPNLHEVIECLPNTGKPKYEPVETEEYLVRRLGETCELLILLPSSPHGDSPSPVDVTHRYKVGGE